METELFKILDVSEYIIYHHINKKKIKIRQKRKEKGKKKCFLLKNVIYILQSVAKLILKCLFIILRDNITNK